MNENIIDLKLPLTEKECREIKLGTLVTVSGLMFTGRSRFHIRAAQNNIVPPIDYSSVNCFFHTGPVMRQVEDGWEVVSIEPTSSIRFEKYSPHVIKKLQLRVLIGKTTMGNATALALKEVGGIHLTKIGICGNMLSEQVKRVKEVHFLDELGKTEATWVLEVDHLGPFFVDIDAHGNNYFTILKKNSDANFTAVYKKLGISEQYEFTDVSG